MWPVVTDKYLIPFLGKPLFYHILKSVVDSISFDEAIIITKENTQDQVSEIAKELGVNFKIAIQKEAKGMADAVLSAKEYLNGEVMIINGDDLLEVEVFKQVLDTASKTRAEVVFAGLKTDKHLQMGYLRLEGDSVKGIVEKPEKGQEPSDVIKLVVDYFKDGEKLATYLENAQSSTDDVYEVALTNLINDGVDIKLSQYNGFWQALKYPWHVLDITEYLLSKIEQKIDPNAKVSDKAIVEGQVIIEEGAKVFEGAVIKGPVYIGKNVLVGNSTMIRGSILEEGCVTGFNSDITRSYIGANSWFHTNYIGDSVIEGDFGMGSGAVLANLRLDNHTIRVGTGKDTWKVGFDSFQVDSGRDKLGLIAGKGSRVGVNASTMPGARIGSNSLVGPGVVLYGDVKENTKVIVKQELQQSEHIPSLTSYDQFRKKL